MRDDPPGLARHERDVAQAERDEVIRRALTAYCENHLVSRRGWTNDVGYTCDELGCMICNGDSAAETADYWLAALAEPVYDEDGYPENWVPDLPFDPDDAEEMAELLEGRE
jgi:hypothetical protein